MKKVCLLTLAIAIATALFIVNGALTTDKGQSYFAELSRINRDYQERYISFLDFRNEIFATATVGENCFGETSITFHVEKIGMHYIHATPAEFDTYMRCFVFSDYKRYLAKIRRQFKTELKQLHNTKRN